MHIIHVKLSDLKKKICELKLEDLSDVTSETVDSYAKSKGETKQCNKIIVFSLLLHQNNV